MTTAPRRRNVWQHDTENISEDQMKEYFHRLGWQVDRFGKDYGEDFFIRIFEEGISTERIFYVQLKGTSDSQQYALKAGNFSYSVETVSLDQWHNNPFPVIFVLWDTKQRLGYWLHIQPYVDTKLKANPAWLTRGDGTRNIHIPSDQILHADRYQALSALITDEYQKISLSRQLLEQLQRSELETIARQLITTLPTGKPSDSQSLESTPLNEEQKYEHICQEISKSPVPENAKSWLKLAAKYYDQMDYEKAVAAVNKAKSLGASGTQYAMIHGSILTEYFVAQGSRRKSLLYEAIELFNSASQEMKGTEKSYADYNIGNALLALGDYQKAIQHFDTALSNHDNNNLAAQIWKNRGTAFFHLGDHKEEFASYQKALALNPNLWEAYASWANTEGRLENYAHAKELYIQAINVYPKLREEHPKQLYDLALICWKLKEFELSYKYANEVLSVRPDHEASLSLKRLLLSSLWRKDSQYIPEALTFFKMWLHDDPADIFVRRELYLLYKAQADQQQASTLLSETEPIVGTSSESLYHYACMLIDEEKISEAIEALDKAYQQSQEHAIVHKLAELKEQTGVYYEAVPLYKLAFANDELRFLEKVSNYYYLLGEHSICIWCCVRAIYLQPLKEFWWNTLIYSLMALEKVMCSILLEKLRLDVMKAISEEGEILVQDASDLSQLVLEIIEAEFDKQFVESILAPSPPF